MKIRTDRERELLTANPFTKKYLEAADKKRTLLGETIHRKVINLLLGIDARDRAQEILAKKYVQKDERQGVGFYSLEQIQRMDKKRADLNQSDIIEVEEILGVKVNGVATEELRNMVLKNIEEKDA